MAQPRSQNPFAGHGAFRPVPIGSAQTLGTLLTGAIESSSSAEHALLLINLDEHPRIEPCGTPGSSEADALLPQLAEIVRGSDVLARVEQGRYAILLHDCSMAQITRKIAAIDFLRAAFGDNYHGGLHEPTPIGTTYLRHDDTPARALARAAAKLDRFR